jgi:hypothetical protein
MNAINGVRELFEQQDYEAIPAYLCKQANIYMLNNSLTFQHLTLRDDNGLTFRRGMHTTSLTRAEAVTEPIEAKPLYICARPSIDQSITDERIIEIVTGISNAVDRLFATTTKHLLKLETEPTELDYAEVEGFIAASLITNQRPEAEADKPVFRIIRERNGKEHTTIVVEFSMLTHVAINIDLVSHE